MRETADNHQTAVGQDFVSGTDVGLSELDVLIAHRADLVNPITVRMRASDGQVFELQITLEAAKALGRDLMLAVLSLTPPVGAGNN